MTNTTNTDLLKTGSSGHSG